MSVVANRRQKPTKNYHLIDIVVCVRSL